MVAKEHCLCASCSNAESALHLQLAGITCHCNEMPNEWPHGFTAGTHSWRDITNRRLCHLVMPSRRYMLHVHVEDSSHIVTACKRNYLDALMPRVRLVTCTMIRAPLTITFMTQAGFDPAATRFGLHSHYQYVNYKQGIVHNTNPANELIATSGGIKCPLSGVIPDRILNLKASDLLDIMGFDCYPARPSDISNAAAQQASLAPLVNILGFKNQVAMRYGTFSSVTRVNMSSKA